MIESRKHSGMGVLQMNSKLECLQGAVPAGNIFSSHVSPFSLSL